MKKQFLHEHHNRLDKAHKAEYRDAIMEDNQSRGGVDPVEIKNFFKRLQEDHKEKQRYLDLVKNALFFGSGLKLRLHWNFSRFIEANISKSSRNIRFNKTTALRREI